MNPIHDPARRGHLPGGERMFLRRGRWVRPDGGPAFMYQPPERVNRWTRAPVVKIRSKLKLREAARAEASKAAESWLDYDMTGHVDGARMKVEALCEVHGIRYPKSKHGVYPEMLRTQCPEWWGRQLKKADRQGAEFAELQAGRVRLYCSDLIMAARMQQRRETMEMLSSLLAICEQDDGSVIERDLLELIKASPANPAIRRAELMVRVRGFEEYAKRAGWVPYFFTFTCPSKYHRNSGAKWEAFDCPSPKVASDYLCRVWASVRASLKRAALELFGFRVAEPHKDACPHWHCLFWFKSHHEARAATAIMRRYFLAVDGNESGAQQHRVTVKMIDAREGSATGYIAKYVCKNVDGLFERDGIEYTAADQRRDRETGEMQDTGATMADAALRVEAWASCWRIRQFQQIGGPAVGVWRELRRLDDLDTGTEAGAIVEPMRQAADAGQWDLFVELELEHRQQYGERVKVWTDTSADMLQRLKEKTPGGIGAVSDEAFRECLNKWQEPCVRKTRGLLAAFASIRTRFMQWLIVLKQAAEAQKARAEQNARFDGWKERIKGALREARAGVEGVAAPPPPPLEFCQ